MAAAPPTCAWNFPGKCLCAVLDPSDEVFLLHLSLLLAAQALGCVNVGSGEMLYLMLSVMPLVG